MTERLYYTDAYLTRFDARVVDTADDGRRVFLDRTAFYPTSGGQPNDLGTLGGIAVTDVVDDGDRVAHILADRLAEGQQRSVFGYRLIHNHAGPLLAQQWFRHIPSERVSCDRY